MAHFAGIEPDADEAVTKRQRQLQRGEGVFLAEVAQEAQDQLRAEAELGMRAAAGVF